MLALVPLIACSKATKEKPKTLPLANCVLRAEGTPARINAACGTFVVPENRETKKGRKLQLRVAVVRAGAETPKPDPLFYLTGGPGMAATDAFPAVAAAFRGINHHRDIVLVDQRGTGGSNPLRCEIPDDLNFSSSNEEQLKGWVEKCLGTLDADPTLYLTGWAMDDLDDVRRALGYEKINLYGVSYGSRAALIYLRRHEKNVRSMTIDGVLPPGIPLGAQVGENAQRSLELILDRCHKDESCKTLFPETTKELEELFALSRNMEERVRVRNPLTGEVARVRLTPGVLSSTIRLFIYSPETAALLPLLVHDACKRKDLDLLSAQSLLIGDSLQVSLANAMNHSVLCAEDAPFFGEEIVAEGVLHEANNERAAIKRLCSMWPRKKVDASFHNPVTSDVPVLLLSGETDPVTPPDNATFAAKTLKNSLHIIVPGQAHQVVDKGCLPKIVRRFVEKGTVDLDTSCVGKIKAPPFFLSFTGPAP